MLVSFVFHTRSSEGSIREALQNALRDIYGFTSDHSGVHFACLFVATKPLGRESNAHELAACSLARGFVCTVWSNKKGQLKLGKNNAK